MLGNQEFVAESHLAAPAAAFDAVENDTADGKALFGFAQHIDDLAVEQHSGVARMSRRTEIVKQRIDWVAVLFARLSHRLADLDREGQGVAHRRILDLLAGHGIASGLADAAHAHANTAR